MKFALSRLPRFAVNLGWVDLIKPTDLLFTNVTAVSCPGHLHCIYSTMYIYGLSERVKLNEYFGITLLLINYKKENRIVKKYAHVISANEV